MDATGWNFSFFHDEGTISLSPEQFQGVFKELNEKNYIKGEASNQYEISG
jgi:hypothetical protein